MSFFFPYPIWIGNSETRKKIMKKLVIMLFVLIMVNGCAVYAPPPPRVVYVDPYVGPTVIVTPVPYYWRHGYYHRR